MSEHFFVYLLELRGGALYTGHTRDIAERLRRHAQGSGSRLTRNFRPLRLARCWRLRGGRATAMRVEAFIKSRPRAEKLDLVRNPTLLGRLLRRETGLRLRPAPFLPGY